jgi:hypothetical protein
VVFQNSARDTTYIVIERIKGLSLDLEWPRIGSASKQAVVFQLRNLSREMRKLASPSGYCSVGRQGIPVGLFWTDNPSNPFARPFGTEAELNKALILKYTESGLVTRGYEQWRQGTLQKLGCMLRTVLRCNIRG